MVECQVEGFFGPFLREVPRHRGDHFFAKICLRVCRGPLQSFFGGALGHLQGKPPQEKTLFVALLERVDPSLCFDRVFPVVALGKFLVEIPAQSSACFPGPRIHFLGRKVRSDGVDVGGPFDRGGELILVPAATDDFEEPEGILVR